VCESCGDDEEKKRKKKRRIEKKGEEKKRKRKKREDGQLTGALSTNCQLLLVLMCTLVPGKPPGTNVHTSTG
jgi:hypothetical protein